MAEPKSQKDDIVIFSALWIHFSLYAVGVHNMLSYTKCWARFHGNWEPTLWKVNSIMPAHYLAAQASSEILTLWQGEFTCSFCKRQTACFCCVQCSSIPEGRYFAVCGPATKKQCMSIHCASWGECGFECNKPSLSCGGHKGEGGWFDSLDAVVVGDTNCTNMHYIHGYCICYCKVFEIGTKIRE